jgi:4-amino-4-deoxy-L-arabinose transferase-like glycosyltransferase
LGRAHYLVGLGLIALAAFVGRVVYVLVVTRHGTIMADELYYVTTADRFASGAGFTAGGFPWTVGDQLAEHPPLTSVILAPWVWISDVQADLPRFAVAAFGAVVVVLVGLIGNEVAGRRVALLAAGLAALYPNLWVNDGLLMSETFAALGSALTLYGAYRLRRTRTMVAAALAGVAAGLAALARAELLLLLPLVLVPVALGLPETPRRRLMLAASASLACVLTVAPWIAYNLNRFERPVLFSLDGGTLLGANCDDTYDGPRLGFWNGYCTLPAPPGDASVHSAEMRHAAFAHIGDHIGRLPVVVAARVGRTWGLYRPFDLVDANEFDGRPRWMGLAQMLSGWIVLGTAIAGAVRLRRHGEKLLILVMPLVVVTLTAAAIYGRDRFRVPAEISLVVLVAVAADGLVGWWRAHATTARPDATTEAGTSPPGVVVPSR